jgi:hypothetical protein
VDIPVELAAIEEQEEIYILKRCSLIEMPDEAMEKKLCDNADDYANDYEDGLDEDDLDMFEGDDSFHWWF